MSRDSQGQGVRFVLRQVRLITAGLCVIVGLSGGPAAYAQGFALEGTVLDATGAAVQGARVEASSGAAARAAVSDAAGRYRIEGLPAGRYTVRAEHAGFAPSTMVADLSTGAATMNLTLTSVVASESVTVEGVVPGARLDSTSDTASRLGLTARETPAVVNVVTFAEAQARGLRTTVEALNTVPGVVSANPGGSIGITAVRGFTGGAVSLLYDGTRLTTSTMVTREYDSWSFDRIEVLKGPASVLFGEGALAGAVNLVSKRPDFSRRRGGVLLSYGSLDTARFAAEATGPLGTRAAYRADVVGSTTNGYISSNQFQTLAMTGGLDLRLSSSATLGLSLEHFADDYDVSYWGTPLVPRAFARQPSDRVTDSRDFVLDEALRDRNYNVTDGLTDSRSTWLRGKFQWQISPAWRLNSEVYWYDALRKWHNAEVYTFQPATSLLTRSTVFIEHDHGFYGNRTSISSDSRIGGRRNRFGAGIEANRNDFFNPRRFGSTTSVDPVNPTRGVFPEVTAQNFPGAGNNTDFTTDLNLVSVFAENALSLAPRVTVVAGVRYDHLGVDRGIADRNAGTNSAFQSTFTPKSWRTGVVVDAAPRTQLFGQYTSAVAPVATILLISQTNLDFKLTTGDSWEGGVKSTLAGGRFESTASVFTITQDDILTRDPNNANITIQGGTQQTTGVEFTVTASPTRRWRVDANATFMDARFETLIEAGGVNRAGNVPPNAPERLAGVWTAYELAPWPLTIAGGVRYHGGFYTNNANSTHVTGYALVDAQATWRVGRGDITVRGKNLTDTFYANWTGASASQLMLGAPRTVDVAYHVRF
jgi:iron complex outermembrane receptor protein